MRNLLVLASALALVACGSTSTTSNATTIAALEIALTSADQLALKYVTLPKCPVTNGTLCSDAATVSKIKTSAQVAYDALKGAQAGTSSITLAQQAVAALVAVTPVTQ